MFISDNRKEYWKPLFSWLALTVFCAVFSLIYELCSHHVYSAFMVCLCLFPLIGGVLPNYFLKASGRERPDRKVQTLHLWGVLTLTMGSLLDGIIEIYGTSSGLILYYWVAGPVLLGAAVFFGWKEQKRKPNPLSYDRDDLF